MAIPLWNYKSIYFQQDTKTRHEKNTILSFYFLFDNGARGQKNPPAFDPGEVETFFQKISLPLLSVIFIDKPHPVKYPIRELIR